MSEENVKPESFLGGDADAEEQRASGAPQAAALAGEETGNGGGCLSNTYLSTSQIGLEGFPEYSASGGFDWLEWSAAVAWKSARFAAICELFQVAKSFCQQNGIADTWKELPGVGEVRVGRMGLNRGGDRGQHFDFRVCFRGVWIGLAKRERGTDRLPNVYVRQTGRDCLLFGAVEAYRIVREFIKRLGARIIVEKISRADFCLDVAGLDIVELQSAVERRQFVTRAGSVRPHVDMVSEIRSGFTVGAYPLHLVAYDKLVEQRLKCDYLYFQALIDRRWGGNAPEKAGRIEFQVSRPLFVKNGINSPADLFRLGGSLVELFTEDWFRLTTEPVDRENNHQGRAEVLPVWKSISLAFAAVFGQPAGPLAPLDRKRITPIRLLQQARGTLATALLQLGEQVQTYDDFIFAAAKQLYSLAKLTGDQAKFLELYNRRAKEHLG